MFDKLQYILPISEKTTMTVSIPVVFTTENKFLRVTQCLVKIDLETCIFSYMHASYIRVSTVREKVREK